MSNPWRESFEDLRSSIEEAEELTSKQARQAIISIRNLAKRDGSTLQKAYSDYITSHSLSAKVAAVVRSKLTEQVTQEVSEEESKESPKRWWDDDGDNIGYESGEVSGKFKKKKKSVRKEGYSDWRSEMPENFFFESLTEKVSPASPYCDVMPDQKSGENQKDPQRGTQNQKLLKMRKEDLDLLAEELGGEVLDAEILDEGIGGIAGRVFKTALKTAELKVGKDAPGAIVKYKPPGKLAAPKVTGKVTKSSKTKPGAIVKAEPKTTAITKPKTKTATITKTKTKTAVKDLAKIQTGTLVKTDPKTGAIVSGGTKSQTSLPPPPINIPSGKPGRGFNISIPIPGLPKMKEPSREIGFVKTHQINK